MAYVNQDPNAPLPPAPRFPFGPPDFSRIVPRLVHPRLRLGCMVTIAALMAALVVLLALAPPYAGLDAGPDWQPARVFEPVRHYLFRNAVVNSGILLAGVYPLALALGWTWAVTGVPLPARPFLLVPIFMPGALVGLLWRPIFAGWLELALVPVALTVTGLVMLWRAVPLAAWFFSRDRDNWLKFVPLCALTILLDSTLILTLTRGEPFNAAHSWPSWWLQQLWVNRAWGHAASMGSALALALAALTWWAARRSHSPHTVPHGSPLGLATLLLWIVGPLILPLFWFVQAPAQAFSDLAARGALRWTMNGALVWVGAMLLARAWAWPLSTPRARRTALTLTVAMLPITVVAFAYLAYAWPLLRGLWSLLPLAGLLTAGLLMGVPRSSPAHGMGWRNAAGAAALVSAVTFPLQLVMQLPAPAWTPALGITWTLAEDTHARAALGLALILVTLWATMGAYMIGDLPDRCGKSASHA